MADIALRHEDGTADVRSIKGRKDQRRLMDAAQRLAALREEEKELKAVIDEVLERAGMDKVQCGSVRAYRLPQVKESLSGAALLEAGIRPIHIARAASTVNKGKLLGLGADADVVQDCVTETPYVKVYVKEMRKEES